MLNAQVVKTPTWMDTLTGYLPALRAPQLDRHRRLGLPAQISPGIETIVTGEDHFAVLERVLKAVDAAKHIRPKIWLDKELAFVAEDLAPGADDARRRLDEALKGRGAMPSCTRTSSPGSTKPVRRSRSSWSRRPSPSPTRRSSWSSTAAIGPPKTRP